MHAYYSWLAVDYKVFSKSVIFVGAEVVTPNEGSPDSYFVNTIEA